jgi:hypothetical protein
MGDDDACHVGRDDVRDVITDASRAVSPFEMVGDCGEAPGDDEVDDLAQPGEIAICGLCKS